MVPLALLASGFRLLAEKKSMHFLPGIYNVARTLDLFNANKLSYCTGMNPGGGREDESHGPDC